MGAPTFPFAAQFHLIRKNRRLAPVPQLTSPIFINHSSLIVDPLSSLTAVTENESKIASLPPSPPSLLPFKFQPQMSIS